MKDYAIIFDTNALLDLYQEEGIFFDLIGYLKKVEEKIIILNQVYDEYIVNFERIKSREKELYENIIKQLNDLGTELRKKNNIQKFLLKKIGDNILFEEVCTNIEKELKKVQDKVNILKQAKSKTSLLEKDILKELIERKKETQSIKEFTVKDHIELFKEATEREEYKIPPGLTDGKKTTDSSYYNLKRRHGDFIIWKEILEYAKENQNKKIYFIQNEKKTDWWEGKSENRVFSKILMKEFKEQSQNELIVLDLEGFFKEFKNILNLPDSELKSLKAHIEIFNNTLLKIESNKENDMLELSDNNYYDFIYKYLENNLLNLLTETGDETIFINEITGSKFEYISELDVYLNKVKRCKLEKNNLSEAILSGEVEIECDIRFNEEGGRHVGFFKNITAIVDLNIEIVYFNFNIKEEEFEQNLLKVKNVEIQSLDYDETELAIYED
ncbi:PIN-like domain-containing protein [Cetobacterium sp.]|uniref:PIN-like domain-containing protein n=1 Tax=Cetobacterium sp. TaxID=2071632 RepID=UPI003F2FE9DD